MHRISLKKLQKNHVSMLQKTEILNWKKCKQSITYFARVNDGNDFGRDLFDDNSKRHDEFVQNHAEISKKK